MQMKISSINHGMSVLYNITHLLNNNYEDNGEILITMFDMN